MNPTQIRRTYRWMAPVYDTVFRRFYRKMRRASIANLDLRSSDTVVLVGAGTGLDLPLLPCGCRAIAFDLSPAMLNRAAKARHSPIQDCVLADGGALPLRDASVSAVVLHLVLSVAPDPKAVLQEAARVLPPGGRIAILDHFAPLGHVGVLRRLLTRVPSLIGTHLDRHLESMIRGLPLKVVRDQHRIRGFYRVLLVELVDGDSERIRGA